MTEFGTVTQMGRITFLKGQPRPRPKGAMPQGPQQFWDLRTPKRATKFGTVTRGARSCFYGLATPNSKGQGPCVPKIFETPVYAQTV